MQKKASLKFLKCEVYETESRTKNDIVLGCSNEGGYKKVRKSFENILFQQVIFIFE
jgi:hypothetical protein